MYHIKTWFWIVALLALLALLGFAGCSSNTLSSSGYGEGAGYKMNLTATNTTIPYGGQSTLIVFVKDASGNPVNDSSATAITYSSTQGGTFTGATPLDGGESHAVYAAPAASTTTTQTSVVDQITVSYKGAIAYVSIFVYKP
jgi:hypothetical protein